jgi:hypothetical protein
MDNRVKHHPPKSDETVRRHQAAREAANSLLEAIEILSWGPSRESSLAATKVEEALFWLNAEIARNQ